MVKADAVKETSDSLTKALLLGGALAGPVFTILWIIGGVVAQPGYDPLRHFVSSLSSSDSGWMQIASFIITGLLLVGFAIGLRRASLPASGAVLGPVLFGLVGLGLIGAGIFVSDPVLGYPPGTPLMPTVRTTHGILHDLFGIPVFLGLPIGSILFSRRFARLNERGWAMYSAFTGIAMFVTFFFARLGVRLTPDFGFAGLLQRIVLILAFTWITLLALHLLKARSEVTSSN